MDCPSPKIYLKDFDLDTAEQRQCFAVDLAQNIVGAAQWSGLY